MTQYYIYNLRKTEIGQWLVEEFKTNPHTGKFFFNLSVTSGSDKSIVLERARIIAAKNNGLVTEENKVDRKTMKAFKEHPLYSEWKKSKT